MRLFENSAIKIELFPSKKDKLKTADGESRHQHGEFKRAPRTEHDLVMDNSRPLASQQARYEGKASKHSEQSRHIDARPGRQAERPNTDAASDQNERLQKQYEKVYVPTSQSAYSQGQPHVHVPRDEGTRAKPNASTSEGVVSANDYEPVRGKADENQPHARGLRRTGSARNLQKDQPETNHDEVRRARSNEPMDNGKRRTDIPRGAPHSTNHALRKPRSRVELAKASENMARTLSRSPARGSPARRPGNSLRTISSDERPGTSGTSGSGTSKLTQEVDVADKSSTERGKGHLIASDNPALNPLARSEYQATRTLPDRIPEEDARREGPKHDFTMSKTDGGHIQVHLPKEGNVAEASQHGPDSKAANSTPQNKGDAAVGEGKCHKRNDSKATAYNNANKGPVITVPSPNANAAQQANPHSSAHTITAGSEHPSGLRSHPKPSDEHNIRVKLPPSCTSHGAGDRKVTNFSRPSNAGTTNNTSRPGTSSSVESSGSASQYRSANLQSSSINASQSHVSEPQASETAHPAKSTSRPQINSKVSQAFDFATRSASNDGADKASPKKDYISSSGAKGPGNKYVDSSNSTRSPFTSLFVDNTSGAPKDPRTVGVGTSDKGTGKVKHVKKARSKDRVNGAGDKLPNNGSVEYEKEGAVRNGTRERRGKEARKDSGQSDTDYAERREVAFGAGHHAPPSTPAKVVRVGV